MVIVRLQSAGPQKIATIKVVRELSGCGLKEAKDLVEAAPVNLRLELQSDAHEVVASFAAIGVTVEVLGEVGVSQGPAAPNGGGPFRIAVDDVGNRKIEVIKTIREVTRLDLLSAKQLADRGAFTLEQEYDRAGAEQIAALFGRAGARARIVGGTAPAKPSPPPPGKIGPIPY